MRRLRPWSPERDATAVLAAFLASEDLHRQAPPIRDLDEARAYVAAIAGEGWAIDEGTPEAPRAVGGVLASDRDPRHGTAWMSYWLAPEARGRGLTTAALDAASRRLLGDGLHRLELGARTNNPASVAVAERAGYVRECVERERLCYGDERFDVVRLARLATDPAPAAEPLPIEGR